MTIDEKEKFVRLMYAIAEAVAGNEEMRVPSDMKIDLYFQGLADLSLNIISDNAAQYLRTNRKGFFPTIADLRNEPDPEDIAREKFDKFQRVIECYYMPGFGSSYDIVIDKLKEYNLEDMIPYLNTYGLEIVNQDNISATRAQFVKQYTAQHHIDTSRQIERSTETKSIGDVLAGLIDDGDNDKPKIEIY